MMKQLLKLSLKYFLVVAILYGILMLLLDMITGREITVNAVGIRILIFGIGMTLILVSFHKYQVRKIASKYAVENPALEVRQVRKLSSKLSPAEIYDQLKTRSDFDKITFDTRTEIINIKTGFSGKSWGDRITISPKKRDYNYKITIKPIFPLTVIDFGQSFENILKLENRIKSLG